jgi:multidrug resistance efflux pump
VSDFPTAIQGDAALPLPVASETSAKAVRIPMRPIKIGIGISLLMAGVYGVVSDRQFLSTDNAVVTAYLTDIRTPIDGVLTGMPPSAGGLLPRNAVLGAVDNQLFDQQHLQNLGIIAEEAESGAAAAQTERLALQAQEQDLLERANLHMQAVSARLQGQRAEAQRLLAERTADLEESGRELERGRQLHDAGILADSEFEKLRSRNQVAAAAAAAQQAAIATLESELRSASAGVLSEPGINNDVPYSRQRADEIRLRLAEIDRTQSTLQAQAEEAKSSLDAERARIGLLRHSDLITPVSGMLWKLDAVNGERVASGEAVARIVECSRIFVLAEVPQERVPEIAVEASARLRLSGETRERFGKVLAISGDPQRDDDRKLAAFPAQNPRQHLATVRISLDPNSDDCPVGRSATVLISIAEGSPVGRLWRQFF